MDKHPKNTLIRARFPFVNYRDPSVDYTLSTFLIEANKLGLNMVVHKMMESIDGIMHTEVYIMLDEPNLNAHPSLLKHLVTLNKYIGWSTIVDEPPEE